MIIAEFPKEHHPEKSSFTFWHPENSQGHYYSISFTNFKLSSNYLFPFCCWVCRSASTDIRLPNPTTFRRACKLTANAMDIKIYGNNHQDNMLTICSFELDPSRSLHFYDRKVVNCRRALQLDNETGTHGANRIDAGFQLFSISQFLTFYSLAYAKQKLDPRISQVKGCGLSIDTTPFWTWHIRISLTTSSHAWCVRRAPSQWQYTGVVVNIVELF